MKAILIRVGIDLKYGGWNAPVDPHTKQFVYVPIPESQRPLPNLARTYDEIVPALQRFSDALRLDPDTCPTIPQGLIGRPMHLDPDFEHLSYGDNGDNRGAKLKDFVSGDLVVFYAGLRPIRSSKRLLYALIGLFTVDRVELAKYVPEERWHENAHTRKLKIGGPDIIVRAQKTKSGRLERVIAIGEWRDAAYRVTRETLNLWGGLDIKDGFIQRSASPPSFLKPAIFYEWFLKQGVSLIERNN